MISNPMGEALRAKPDTGSHKTEPTRLRSRSGWDFANSPPVVRRRPFRENEPLMGSFLRCAEIVKARLLVYNRATCWVQVIFMKSQPEKRAQ
jgi:hypothetical protein